MVGIIYVIKIFTIRISYTENLKIICYTRSILFNFLVN